jgi:hypothetical protein
MSRDPFYQQDADDVQSSISFSEKIVNPNPGAFCNRPGFSFTTDYFITPKVIQSPPVFKFQGIKSRDDSDLTVLF